jgi:CxxC motif-containing protein (DUF1111 family)
MVKMKHFRLGQLACVSTVVILVCRSVALPAVAVAQNATALNFGPPSFGGPGGGGPGGPKSIDPGVRGGPAGAGGPLAGLDADEQAFFAAAKNVFTEVDSVPDGLGPRFNLDSCAGCHAAPAVGGSSPVTNPQVGVATATKANALANPVPSFITSTGPVREARFVRNPDGTPDGGVHDLFVITGRNDAPGCKIKQPDFVTALAQNNVVFRIPTPTFGLGLVESVPDSHLQAVQSANGLMAGIMGISGEFNRSGNDGTITRFGWKAQNKSLLVFAGEAYNVEQGVTNELFPNERETNPSCQYNATPEDRTPIVGVVDPTSKPLDYSSDVVSFAMFMRLAAPPSPVPDITTALNSPGGKLFKSIGCNACHAIKQTTSQSGYTGQSQVDFFPFSDFALHAMGNGLADGITQGNANGSEFRTAPLWGVGQRIFFLHDGRTSDLYQATIAHASNGSEANTVISHFQMLSTADQQALVNFLRSL